MGKNKARIALVLALLSGFGSKNGAYAWPPCHTHCDSHHCDRYHCNCLDCTLARLSSKSFRAFLESKSKHRYLLLVPALGVPTCNVLYKMYKEKAEHMDLVTADAGYLKVKFERLLLNHQDMFGNYSSLVNVFASSVEQNVREIENLSDNSNLVKLSDFAFGRDDLVKGTYCRECSGQELKFDMKTATVQSFDFLRNIILNASNNFYIFRLNLMNFLTRNLFSKYRIFDDSSHMDPFTFNCEINLAAIQTNFSVNFFVENTDLRAKYKVKVFMDYSRYFNNFNNKLRVEVECI